MITPEQRGNAIRSANFVRDSISKSFRDIDYDACPEEVVEHLEHQLSLFKALKFIRDYTVLRPADTDTITIQVITNTGDML